MYLRFTDKVTIENRLLLTPPNYLTINIFKDLYVNF